VKKTETKTGEEAEVIASASIPLSTGIVGSEDAEGPGVIGNKLVVKDNGAGTGTDVSTGIDWEKDAGGGLEGADKESYAIPFLRVIQKMSPQVDETAAEYMPDAKPGMLLNTVTGRLYDGKKGLTVLPVFYSRKFLKWGARGTDNSGFKGQFSPEDIAKMTAREEIKLVEGRLFEPAPDGTVDVKKAPVFNDTRTHFFIVLEEDGSMSQCVIALSSTQIKKSKRLMALLSGAIINGKTPPTWMNQIKLTTVPESNEKGSWSGVRFESDGFIQIPSYYMAGKEFHDSILQGEVGVAYEVLDDGMPDNGGEIIEGEKF